jgi:hypothetical protein
LALCTVIPITVPRARRSNAPSALSPACLHSAQGTVLVKDTRSPEACIFTARRALFRLFMVPIDATRLHSYIDQLTSSLNAAEYTTKQNRRRRHAPRSLPPSCPRVNCRRVCGTFPPFEYTRNATRMEPSVASFCLKRIWAIPNQTVCCSRATCPLFYFKFIWREAPPIRLQIRLDFPHLEVQQCDASTVFMDGSQLHLRSSL